MPKFLISILTLSLLLLFGCSRLDFDTSRLEVSDIPVCLLGDAADGIGQNGIGQNGARQDGTGQNGTGTYKLGLERIGQDGTGTYRMGLERVVQLGFGFIENIQEKINV